MKKEYEWLCAICLDIADVMNNGTTLCADHAQVRAGIRRTVAETTILTEPKGGEANE